MERKKKGWIVIGALVLFLIVIIPLKVLWSETDRNLQLLAISIILSAFLGGANMFKFLFANNVEQKRYHFIEYYASDEMGNGIERLREFEQDHKSNHAMIFIERLQRKDPDAKRLNRDRRRYTHHFYKILKVFETVDDKFVRSVVDIGQVKFLLDIIEPMEEAKNPEYDKWMFDEYRRIYKEDLKEG